MNFFQNVLNSVFVDYEFPDMRMPFSKYLTFSIEGFDEFTMVVDDENLNCAVELMRFQLEKLYDLYNEKYIFFEPQLIIQPSPLVIKMKIGMLDKERYKEIVSRP